VILGDADHSFRGDRDQLIAIAGRVITMPGTLIGIRAEYRSTSSESPPNVS
jgi:hypothetical protein